MTDFRSYVLVAINKIVDPALRTILSLCMTGKLNVVSEVTLTANAASTTLNDDLINENSQLIMTPRTANAQAITWRQGATGAGTLTINHTNDANADKTFRYSILG